jgi:heptosyltransferase-3
MSALFDADIGTARKNSVGSKSGLIISFKNIGDMVLLTPLIEVLRKRAQLARLDLLVNDFSHEVLLNNPSISNLIPFKRSGGIMARAKDALSLLIKIRVAKYDFVVLTTGSNTAQWLAFLSGAKVRVAAMVGKKFFFFPVVTHRVKLPSRGRHYIDRNLDIARSLGLLIAPQDKIPRIYEGGEATKAVENYIARENIAGRRFFIVHPVSRWMFKTCLPATISTLVKHLWEKHRIISVLTSGSDPIEKAYIRDVCRTVPEGSINMAGKLSLMEMAAFIRAAHAFVGVDTAPMHIASATDTPTFAIFGPSSEEDWGPRASRSFVYSVSSFACRPCQMDGCGGSKQSECLTEIDERDLCYKLDNFILSIYE